MRYLIVHSAHTKNLAKSFIKKYQIKNFDFLLIKRTPTKKTLTTEKTGDIFFGIGGGSVLDTAKILAFRNKKPCLVFPTTAAGASCTPYATIWGKQKSSEVVARPFLISDPILIPEKLPKKLIESTLSDCLAHAVESFWSKHATKESKNYSLNTISLIKKFIKEKNVADLIKAGNYGGRAIAIAKTNAIHACSYPLSLNYNIDHGTACGILLPEIIKFMNYKKLPSLPFLKIKKIKNKIDIKTIATQALKYDRINNGPKRLDQLSLQTILGNLFSAL